MCRGEGGKQGEVRKGGVEGEGRLMGGGVAARSPAAVGRRWWGGGGTRRKTSRRRAAEGRDARSRGRQTKG
jgi:hypothetical protein